jgi:hypothetical protein
MTAVGGIQADPPGVPLHVLREVVTMFRLSLRFIRDFEGPQAL